MPNFIFDTERPKSIYNLLVEAWCSSCSSPRSILKCCVIVLSNLLSWNTLKCLPVPLFIRISFLRLSASSIYSWHEVIKAFGQDNIFDCFLTASWIHKTCRENYFQMLSHWDIAFRSPCNFKIRDFFNQNIFLKKEQLTHVQNLCCRKCHYISV